MKTCFLVLTFSMLIGATCGLFAQVDPNGVNDNILGSNPTVIPLDASGNGSITDFMNTSDTDFFRLNLPSCGSWKIEITGIGVPGVVFFNFAVAQEYKNGSAWSKAQVFLLLCGVRLCHAFCNPSMGIGLC